MSWSFSGYTNIRTMSGTPVVEEDQKPRPRRKKVYTVTPNLVGKLIHLPLEVLDLPPWNVIRVGSLLNEGDDDSKANCGIYSWKTGFLFVGTVSFIACSRGFSMSPQSSLSWK